MTNKISDRVDAFRTAGEAIGLLFGAREAELAAYSEGGHAKQGDVLKHAWNCPKTLQVARRDVPEAVEG